MFKIVHSNPEVKRIHRVGTREDKIHGTFDFGDLEFKTKKEAESRIEEEHTARTVMCPDHLTVVKC